MASAIADEIGAGRTGIRISPENTFNDIAESDVHTLYGALIRELSRFGLAYLHVAHMGDEVLLRKFRCMWPGVLILNRGGADLPARLRAATQSGRIDAQLDFFGGGYVTIAVEGLRIPPHYRRFRSREVIRGPVGGGADAATAAVVAELADLVARGEREVPIAGFFAPRRCAGCVPTARIAPHPRQVGAATVSDGAIAGRETHLPGICNFFSSLQLLVSRYRLPTQA